MTENDRKLLLETSLGLAALIELLSDGEGLASLNHCRRTFHERMAPLLNEAVRERAASRTGEVHE